MNKLESLLVAVGASLVVAGVGLGVRRGMVAPRIKPIVPGPVYSIAGYIDLACARNFLRELGRLEGRSFNLVLHTYGGSITAAIMINEAIQTAGLSFACVVPHVAMSAGTLLMLQAESIHAGRFAYCSPVDPQINGCPAREMPREMTAAGQYSKLVRDVLRRLLRERQELRDYPERQTQIERLLSGEVVPHEWPILIQSLIDVGMVVTEADAGWRELVPAGGEGI